MSFSTIAIAASAKAGIQSKEDANIIEFVEAPWGLGMTLFPVQKVILKAHYGLELDDTKKFKISDWRRENWKELTEKEYLKHIYDDGRCNIGEVIPGHERREMVLSIGRRSGKCVLGDTLVLTDNGIFRIDQLGDTKGSEFQPLKVTIAQEGKGVTSQSEFFYNGGVKPVFKFKTHCGYRLGGTGNHRIKVLSDKGDIEWKYLSDLKLGDTVCIHRDTNLWGRDNTLKIEEAISLGGENKEFVPDAILTSNSDIVKAYLKGVFKEENVIYSTNQEYKHHLQILLLNLGVVSKCDSKSLSILEIEKTDSYYYDPVTEITTDLQPVYDLNVPNGSMFVANGMTNHNTTISACIAAYETYKLIKKTDPQAYYGLPASNNIQIISVATDKDQAGLLYNEVSGHFRNCAFFGPYTANNTQSYARFQTPKDVERYGRYIEDPTAKATLKVTFRSCVAKGLRGAGNICVIMDEIAHFTETGQSGAEEVYNAVVPSTSAYSPKDPTDRRIPVGPVEGRVISISSPLGKQGLFYKLFQIGMQGGKASSNMLCVQAPTWEVNPTVPATEFEKHYLKNPTVFFTEYGGEFTDRTRGWIEDSKDLLKCVNPKRTAVERGQAKKPHFIGIDLALVGDGTAIAIGHVEEDKIILDKIDMIKAGEGKFANKERLDFDDVADWVLEYSKKFYITEGIFDQWAGIPFEQALQKRGLSQMKTVNMTKQITSQMFQNFKDMMWDERLELYDKPNAENTNQHEAYLNELMELQSTVHSKNLITVEAPQVDGKHDDMSDALVRMVWIASQNVGKQKMIYTAGGYPGGMYSPKRGGEIYFGRNPILGNSTGRVAPKLPTSRGGSLRDRIIGRR
jgi:intein/homing endonuclease